MAALPRAYFVCVGNAGRSQMAQAFWEAAGGEARSAGSRPADAVHPEVVRAMAELGVDLSDRRPKPLTAEDAAWADVVVTMGCGDACPVVPCTRYVDWDLTDPRGLDVDGVRAIRDEVRTRIARLAAEASPLELTILRPDDWPDVAAIYEDGIAGGLATFETVVPSWRDWDDGHLPAPRLVARRGGAVVGWAALSPVSGRCVYAGVAEVSVYVATWAHGQGVGRALLERLVQDSPTYGLWTLQAGIFAENAASVALHHACGFRTVGVRERLGQLHGVWHDVLLLERRAATA